MLVDDADEARKMFYRLSRAHEVLTDEQGRRIYDESLGDGGAALDRVRAQHGPSWGQGCQNAAYGCQGANIVHTSLGLGTERTSTLGTFGNAAACLEACEADARCQAYAHYTIAFQAMGSDGSTRPNAGKCEMRQWVDEELFWRPVHEPFVTSGFCPSAARKHAAAKYGRTSLARQMLRLWYGLRSLPGQVEASLRGSPEAWGTLAAVVVGTWALLWWRERRRVAMYAALQEQREAYRQEELARMKEEIWHRENAKKLEKQLKREVYEAKKLEEERMAKELAANEVLLRERMQSKYTVLEERKREAREQQRLQELETRRRKEEESLRKSLPGLYREVARETGEYTDTVGNTTSAVPRRLGGAQAMTTRADAAPEAVRRETVRAAQERLDQAVMAGEVPDQESLLQIEQERRAGLQQAARRAEKERLEKALPQICRDSGDRLGGAPVEAGEIDAGPRRGGVEEEEAGAGEGDGVRGSSYIPTDAQQVLFHHAEHLFLQTGGVSRVHGARYLSLPWCRWNGPGRVERTKMAGMCGAKADCDSQQRRAAVMDPTGRYAAAAAAAAAERREQQLADAGVLQQELARVEYEHSERQMLEQEAERKVCLISQQCSPVLSRGWSVEGRHVLWSLVCDCHVLESSLCVHVWFCRRRKRNANTWPSRSRPSTKTPWRVTFLEAVMSLALHAGMRAQTDKQGIRTCRPVRSGGRRQ